MEYTDHAASVTAGLCMIYMLVLASRHGMQAHHLIVAVMQTTQHKKPVYLVL